MEDDPKAVAAEILGEMKSGKNGSEKEPDDDDDAGISAADALKDMYGSMQSGDFTAAASALKAAIAASED